MRSFNEALLYCVAPLAAVYITTGYSTDLRAAECAGQAASATELSDLAVGVNHAHYRFTNADIAPLVSALSSQGIENFICWINPNTGSLDIVTQPDHKPHLDIKPGQCPNNVDVNADADDDDDDGDGDHDGGGDAVAMIAVVPIALLGNAFDVTQTDISSVRLSMVDTLQPGPGEILPLSVQFHDVGTPFDGTSCGCTSAGPDGVLDINMQFSRQEMVNTFGLQTFANHVLVPLKVTGMVTGGRAIFGTRDCIRIINH